MKIFLKTRTSIVLIIAYAITNDCCAQLTIPWGAKVNVTFGKGDKNPGSPLSQGNTNFTYTSDTCSVPAGYYAIVNSINCASMSSILSDAGHLFFGPLKLKSFNDSGYMMLVTYSSAMSKKIVFADTVRNLCGNSSYLFWAGILSTYSRCFSPNLTFSVETLSGTAIQQFETGDIAGATDNYKWYPGYYDSTKKPPSFPYYGGTFNLPAGVNDIVVKIFVNGSAPSLDCTASFAIDNIILSAAGPGVRISVTGNPDAFIASTCYEGKDSLKLNGNIDSGYYKFGTTEFIPASYNNPAVQWQQSVDNGYTWTDIPDETSLNLSHKFTIMDTFYIRLRAAENSNKNNLNCNVVSNVLKVQVNGLPSDFDITSNSPVCTDSDITLSVSGGASYVVNGPNGFFDDSPFPHVYHPVLADSGWYYAQIISEGGCVANDSTFVKVMGPDVTKVTSSADTICYGQKVRLLAIGGVKYLWSPPETLDNANIANPIAKPVVTTTYKIKITDEAGCGAYSSVTIRLRDSVLKASLIAPGIICPFDNVIFKDISIGKITIWQWDFGNGHTSRIQNPPMQNYSQSSVNTDYPVKLIVTDSSGCSDTSTVNIKSVWNCYIAVPSAFTPNGDGLNDFLYPLNAYKATKLSFTVYNRLGQLVFTTNNWTKKWDGNISGEPQPAGVYVWILEYNDADNKRVSIKGSTMLIR